MVTFNEKKADERKPMTVNLGRAEREALGSLASITQLSVSEVVRALIPTPSLVGALAAQAMYEKKAGILPDTPEAWRQRILGAFGGAMTGYVCEQMATDRYHSIREQLQYLWSLPDGHAQVFALYSQFTYAKVGLSGYRFERVKVFQPGLAAGDVAPREVWMVVTPQDTPDSIRVFRQSLSMHIGKQVLGAQMDADWGRTLVQVFYQEDNPKPVKAI